MGLILFGIEQAKFDGKCSKAKPTRVVPLWEHNGGEEADNRELIDKDKRSSSLCG